MYNSIHNHNERQCHVSHDDNRFQLLTQSVSHVRNFVEILQKDYQQ